MHTMPISSLILLVVATGCSSVHDIRDIRKGSGVCEVHHVAMRSVKVPRVIGCALPTIPFYEAWQSSFPNIPPRGPASRTERDLAYVCDQCIHAHDEWLRTH